MTSLTKGSIAALIVTLFLLIELFDFGNVLERALPGSVAIPVLAIMLVSEGLAMTMYLIVAFVTGREWRQILLNLTLWSVLILGTGMLTYSFAFRK
jgi:hypothetical protein